MIRYLFKNIRPFSWFSMVYQSERNILNKGKNRSKKESDSYSIQHERVQPFFKVNGDETLRLDYNLNESSIVFDVGGYKGEFARDIFCKYQPLIFIFEPFPEFFEMISKRFIKNVKVKPYNFGLSDQTCKTLIGVNNDASSTISLGTNSREISIVSVLEFIKKNNIQVVDLLKLNIEGGEYSLLEVIIKDGNIQMFKNIQVQFHDFIIPNAKERMEKIQNELSKTHHLTYQFEFVWENWELNE